MQDRRSARSALPSPPAGGVMLRDVQPADVAALFAFESDPAWCAMALVKPRSEAAFMAVWEKILRDRAAGTAVPGLVQKVIVVDGEICGSIGCHLRDGRCHVGFGLGRAHWGRGIASHALALFLAGAGVRPLYATAAASNAASIRVLLKNGFVIAGTRTAPETERYQARDEAMLVLA